MRPISRHHTLTKSSPNRGEQGRQVLPESVVRLDCLGSKCLARKSTQPGPRSVKGSVTEWLCR